MLEQLRRRSPLCCFPPFLLWLYLLSLSSCEIIITTTYLWKHKGFSLSSSGKLRSTFLYFLVNAFVLLSSNLCNFLSFVQIVRIQNGSILYSCGRYLQNRVNFVLGPSKGHSSTTARAAEAWLYKMGTHRCPLKTTKAWMSSTPFVGLSRQGLVLVCLWLGSVLTSHSHRGGAVEVLISGKWQQLSGQVSLRKWNSEWRIHRHLRS